jgi:hypothetical protein
LGQASPSPGPFFGRALDPILDPNFPEEIGVRRGFIKKRQRQTKPECDFL